MKIIRPSYLIKEQESGLLGIYKQIEYAGRICYKSSDKITEGSAKGFVERMVKSGHGAMLEHGTVYLKVTCKNTDFVTLSVFYGHNKYSKITHSEDNKTYYITTNYRVLVENNHLGDLKYLCEPTEFHEKRITVHLVLPIGISREFCRHRAFSLAEMSTRYCNFSKNKFDNELTFIEDSWSNLSLLQLIEVEYMKAIKSGQKPQEARNILPLCTKTELIMTGFVSDWEHFFELRCATSAHPQARELSIHLQKEFIKREYIYEQSCRGVE